MSLEKQVHFYTLFFELLQVPRSMHKALYRLTINVWLELDRPRGEKVEQFDEVGILGYASHSPARTKEDLKRIKHDFLLQHTKILPAHSLQH